MPPKRRYYSAGVKEALFMLSRGRCYAPTCQERVLRLIDGEPSINVQTAHIRAHSPNGPRFDASYPEEKRGSFENLILLCTAHHTPVDKKQNETKYPVELLLEWKEQREGDFGAQLDGLDFLSQEDLSGMLSDVVSDTRDEIMSAIDDLGAHVSEETARTLRSFFSETFDRPYLDLDAVAELAHAARSLEHLPDSSGMLSSAAHRLGNLEDNASALSRAAQQLLGLEDNVASLRVAAQKITSARDVLSSGWGSFDSLELDSTMRDLSKVVDRINDASRDLAEAGPGPAIQVDDRQRWQYFKAGFGLGAVLVVALVVIGFLLFNQSAPEQENAPAGNASGHSATGS